jgi:hypothetical protein
MLSETHNENLKPLENPQKALTITEFNSKTLNPPIPVYLPWNLSVEQFKQLLSDDSKDGKPAFGFPALKNWLTTLLNTLDAQQDKSHPFHTNPYRLRELNIEAADWFWPGRLGFVKLQSVIRNDDPDDTKNWTPGAVFLRGGSVAILVSFVSTGTRRCLTNWCEVHCPA